MLNQPVSISELEVSKRPATPSLQSHIRRPICTSAYGLFEIPNRHPWYLVPHQTCASTSSPSSSSQLQTSEPLSFYSVLGSIKYGHSSKKSMDESITKRIHISGLTPAITAKDLSDRLASFGTVKAIDGFGALDALGQPRKFAYATLETTKGKLARCAFAIPQSRISF